MQNTMLKAKLNTDTYTIFHTKPPSKNKNPARDNTANTPAMSTGRTRFPRNSTSDSHPAATLPTTPKISA